MLLLITTYDMFVEGTNRKKITCALNFTDSTCKLSQKSRGIKMAHYAHATITLFSPIRLIIDIENKFMHKDCMALELNKSQEARI